MDGLLAPLPLGPGSAEHLDEVHRHTLLQELVGGHGSHSGPVLLADGLPSHCSQAGYLQPGRVDRVGGLVVLVQAAEQDDLALLGALRDSPVAVAAEEP